MARGLVYIGKIIDIYPIIDADHIESAVVVCGKGGRWQGTVVKGTFKEGDTCQVYLQDSLLPETSEFAFMEKYHYRVRMVRLRGMPSEVLIMPQVVSGEVGADITEPAGVVKYEKPIPASVAGDVAGYFPSLVPKTDQPNFQSVPKMVEVLRWQHFYSTVKADGSSATIYRMDDHFGCCSRNWELKDTPSNAIWNIARKYELAERLPNNIALQMEIVGPGIQKNPMGLKEVDALAFDAYKISGTAGHYMDAARLFELIDLLRMKPVQIVDSNKTFSFLDDEALRVYAEGVYPNGRQREGVVIHPMTEQQVNLGSDGLARLSFKVVNLKYKE